jgi:hypothetical protein
MAGKFDLNIDQGTDFEVTFAYCAGVVGDPTAVGPPFDVTGWTALLQLRTAPGSLVVLSLTDSAGITVGTTDGTFAVAMTAAQTALLTQDCEYDLLATTPAGKPIRIVEGDVIVDLAISVPA